MIFYFSATGNCKYAAQRIAAETGEETCSVLDLRDTCYKCGEEEILGFVMPTYQWKLPIILEDFLKETQFVCSDDTFVFTVSTYGTTPGASGTEARHLLRKQKVNVTAMYSVQMPDTWTPMFDLSDSETVARQNERAEEQLIRVIGKIKNRTAGNHVRLSMPYPVSRICRPLYDSMRRTSHFHLENTCTGCGLCARKCPLHVIELQDEKPVWNRERCAMCLGCLHRCPAFAIQYGKNTKAHGQYQNPHVSV